MNNNVTTPQNAIAGNMQVFHCHSKVYSLWSFYAEEAGVTILLLNPYYAGTIYHRVTIVATPAQTAEILQEHQHLIEVHNITTKP